MVCGSKNPDALIYLCLKTVICCRFCLLVVCSLWIVDDVFGVIGRGGEGKRYISQWRHRDQKGHHPILFILNHILSVYNHMVISRDCSLNEQWGPAYLWTSRISTPHQQRTRSQNLVLCYVVIHSLAYKHHPLVDQYETTRELLLLADPYFLIPLGSDIYLSISINIRQTSSGEDRMLCFQHKEHKMGFSILGILISEHNHQLIRWIGIMQGM